MNPGDFPRHFARPESATIVLQRKPGYTVMGRSHYEREMDIFGY